MIGIQVPSYQAHLSQAQHNERLLTELKATLSYKDWLVTVAFYTGIHYIEADFSNNPNIIHTEITIPTDRSGRWKHSPHVQRENLLIRHKYPPYVWHGLRSLHNASSIARYLLTPGPTATEVGTDAQTHWTDEDARNFVDVDLLNIKNALGFS